jgi:putative tryptophan/tyrosine transport system substrate-binding protein
VIDRRHLVALAGGAALAWPLELRAQQPGRTYRLGVLVLFPRGGSGYVALFDELRRQGFVEGQNLEIDPRGFGLHVDQFPEVAMELAKVPVDVIYAEGNPAIRAAQQASSTIPILGATDDMVGSGLVSSIAHPGGNTTGLSILAAELDGKRQELLIERSPACATLPPWLTPIRRRLGNSRH